MFYTRCLSDSLPCGLSINSSCIFNESLFCFCCCCFADFSDKNSEKGTNVPQQRRRRSAAAESSLMWWNPKCHQIPLSKNVSSIIWRGKKKKQQIANKTSAGKCQAGARAAISITKAADEPLAFIAKSEGGAPHSTAPRTYWMKAARDISIHSCISCKV